MIEIEILFMLIIISVLWLTNHLVFKIAGKNKKKRILSGLVVVLFTPVIYFLTFAAVGPFDPGGFGTAIVSLFYGLLFFVIGVVVIMIGLFTKNGKPDVA